MLRSHFRIATRNLWKHKGFSVINIAGLALGIACSLLIFLWVQDERSVDTFHANSTRIYSVYKRLYHEGSIDGGYQTPGLLADELKRTMPEIEKASGQGWASTKAFASGDKIQREEGRAAGADFFEIFSYPLLEGTAREALSAPENIAISRKMATAFFGSPEKAMHKTIRYDNRADFTVSAVFEDLPANASQRFDFLLNWEALKKENSWLLDWGNNGPETIILLRPGANAALLEQKIVSFLRTYNRQNPGYYAELGLQRYDERYLHSRFENGKISGGRITYVKLFSLVAVFILLIACINFMNLTTARSANRLKEIGVRKAMGAVRGQLVRQFIGEAVLIAFLAGILALLLVMLVLPAFNQLASKAIVLPLHQPLFWASLAGLTLFTGVIAGSYPALFLSSFHPVKVLKGQLQQKGSSLWLRKGLVTFQFTLSIVLIISTILVSRQIHFIQAANLGYDRDNLVCIPVEGDLAAQKTVFKQEALQLPGVMAVSQMLGSPTDLTLQTNGVDWEGRDPNVKSYFNHSTVGYDFVKTMHLQLTAGRDFSREFATDSVGYVLNETAAKKIGFKAPVGQQLSFWGKKGQIIGVVRDFHFQSLHKQIEPLILRLDNSRASGIFGTFQAGSFLVRIQPGKTRQALSALEQLHQRLNPRYPFSYQFSDLEYDRLYKSEQVIGRLSVIFAVLAIFISCLGLLGLSVFTAEQKTKEISIRKILGASSLSLFRVLSADFMLLVGLAFLIAVPLAWYAMHQWLQQFAYKTSITWWTFALSGLLAVMIALGTVSIQAIRTININLIKSLRGE
ncbi:ABC transporter permease [Chitinophaga oryzae]|uniref:ABC transporter permease n=1 Tax=Chitinophaga oryzae TaxID=2725414 RepID=A0AAE7DAK8_9BACT|nr:ABC transporter permease [Chitinophaga oryzae]QJB35070.1 ABC transporter permease [Chitinophaga oryzae]